MEINRLNYEMYFIDYHDGNLSASDVEKLNRFLSKNADLKNEFESVKGITLTPPEKSIFEKGKILKKIDETQNIKERNIDEFLIAKVEQHLSTEQEIELKQFLNKNRFYEEDYQDYLQTRLTPDNNIVFAHKSDLRKTPVITLRSIKKTVLASGVAASLFLGSTFLIERESEYTPRKINPTLLGGIGNKQPITTMQFEQCDEQNSKLAINQKVNHLERIKADEVNTELKYKKIQRSWIQKIDVPDIAERVESQALIKGHLINLQTNEEYQDDHLTLKLFIQQKIKEKFFKRNKLIDPPQTPYLRAQRMATIINKVLGTKIKVEPNYDDSGEMTAYAIITPTVEISKKVIRARAE